MDTKEFCRLCFNSTENMLNIFDKTGIEMNMSNILSIHFCFVKILETDELSKSVCRECWKYTDDFNRFYNKVKSSHDKYNSIEHCIAVDHLELSIKSEPGNDACRDNDARQISQISPLKEFVLETDYDSSEKYKNLIGVKKKSQLRSSKRVQIERHSKKKLQSSKRKKLEYHHVGNDEDSVLPNNSSENESSATLTDNNKLESIENTIDFAVLNIDEQISNILLNGEDVKKIKENVKHEDKTNLELIDQKFLESIELDDQIRGYCAMKCELCEYKFITFLTAKKHYRTAHNINGYLRCCNRKFLRRCRALDHIAAYHINPNAFKCDYCGKTFGNKSAMKTHMENHVPEDSRPFKCTKCPKTFVRHNKLAQHQRITHFNEEDKKFQCLECDKSFITKNILTAHVRIVHQLAYSQICDICAKVFKSKYVLKEHRDKHFGVLPNKVQCKICYSWLKDKASLRRHTAKHTFTKLICSICNKEVSSKHALRSHMQYVHSERIHACTMCDKKFKTPLGLREHLASHTGEHLYTCSYCPKVFKSNANMYAHRKKVHPFEWEQDHIKRNTSTTNITTS